MPGCTSLQSWCTHWLLAVYHGHHVAPLQMIESIPCRLQLTVSESLRLVEVAYCQCIGKPGALKGAGCSCSWNWTKDLVTTWTEKYEKLLCWPNFNIYFKCLDVRRHLCGSISFWLKKYTWLHFSACGMFFSSDK